jgi:hypothetical protein
MMKNIILIFLLIFTTGLFAQQPTENEQRKPDLKFLPLAILTGFMSYDYFKDANFYNNEINRIKKIDPDIDLSNYESIKNRKNVMGIIFGVATLANIVFSLHGHKVQAKADNNRLSLIFHL